LRAAREVFSERGYDAATFQAIAIRADLTRPAINHYFSNKRALYREVAKETNALVVAASIQRAQRETTLAGRVFAFIDAATQADIENRTAAAFLITVALESQRHPEMEEADSIRTTREFLLRIVDDAIKGGELASDTDASTLTEALIAVLLGVGFYLGFVANRQEIEAITRQVHQLLAGSLTRGPGTVQ
jgi:TetR/AcrR family transcriptional regulator, repressor for uid operon